MNYSGILIAEIQTIQDATFAGKKRRGDMGNEDVAAGNGVLEEDDTQYMLAQDPGYALYLLKLEQEHLANMRQADHSNSLSYMTQEEFDEEMRREEIYWHGWDELHGEEDNAEE